MEDSIFLAKLLGLFFVITGIGTLANLKDYMRLMHDLSKQESLMVLGGGFDLIVGLFIILSHNVWVADWPVIITLFGWGLLIKGLRLLSPKSAGHWIRKWNSENLLMTIAIFQVILGVCLVYFGFTN